MQQSPLFHVHVDVWCRENSPSKQRPQPVFFFLFMALFIEMINSVCHTVLYAADNMQIPPQRDK